MKFLRTAPTHRLLAVIGGLIAAIAAGTAIAVAAAGPGPVPPPSTLPDALHTALAAPAVNGITARISFTNHLIDASAIQGADPLLQGASGRLWLSADHRLRLELQSDNGDAQVVVNKGSFWVSDPASHTVYEGTLPADTASSGSQDTGKQDTIPTVAQLQSKLNQLMAHVDLSGAIPGDVGGQAAYSVRVSPKHDGGLLGAAQLAWDAARGVPLDIAVYARNDSSPVLELKVSQISYGPVRSSVFNVSPPAAANVVKVNPPASNAAADKAGAARKGKRKHAEVTGVAAVASRLPFTLAAPDSLVGLPRQSVMLLDWSGKPAALVTYGQHLGGIAVIEQTAQPTGSASQSQAQSQGGDRNGLNLPTVSINNITGQELDTALGTMVRFTRSGVTYTVLGSVPPVAAVDAARGL
ncbi:MAG: hypothetical protein JO156_15985 [Solirubrobacterales bacterium]|nr:hypothetical protein [Solirubrobacterales bacterium]